MRFQRPDYSEAKRIILGIVEVNGGSFAGRTAMFKAFFHAHVEYWKRHGKHLTSHPIVRMPNGPGIDNWRDIFNELDGERVWKRSGRDSEMSRETYVIPAGRSATEFTADEREAICHGLNSVIGKGVAKLSNESHGLAWHETPNDGDEMPICLEGLSPQKYAEMNASLQRLKSELDASAS